MPFGRTYCERSKGREEPFLTAFCTAARVRFREAGKFGPESTALKSTLIELGVDMTPLVRSGGWLGCVAILWGRQLESQLDSPQTDALMRFWISPKTL